MKQEILDKLQSQADKKRHDSLPEELKFLMEYPDEEIRSLRGDKLQILEYISIISWILFFRETTFLFPCVGVIILFLWIYGKKKLSKQKELTPVLIAIRSTPKKEIKQLLKKHYKIETIYNYQVTLRHCLFIAISFILTPIILKIISQVN